MTPDQAKSHAFNMLSLYELEHPLKAAEIQHTRNALSAMATPIDPTIIFAILGALASLFLNPTMAAQIITQLNTFIASLNLPIPIPPLPVPPA